MVFKKEKIQDLTEEEKMITPVYARHGLTNPIPKFEIPEKEMLPRSAYHVVHDELMLDGNSRFNLATFCTTYLSSGFIILKIS